MSGFYDETGEDKTIKKTVVGAILAASLVFFAFLLLLYQTTKKHTDPSAKDQAQEEASAETEEDDIVIGKSNKTSKDFDFWDMFSDDEQDHDAETADHSEGKPAVFTEQGPRPDKIKEGVNDSGDTKWENGEPNEGTHIAITDKDGKKTWYEILDIAKSPYSATFVKRSDNGLLTYDENGKKATEGASLSSASSFTDLHPLKELGIDYVMLRAVNRDRESGLVLPDASFNTLAESAKKEEMTVGVYVDSNASNENEAVEEANYAIASATTIGAKYPVAICLPDLSDSDNRMSGLTNDVRTKIVTAFCNQVRSYGMTPMICARKADLIARLNMEDLTAYEVWVKDDGADSDGHPYFTDYPYSYAIWSYGDGSSVTGLNSDVGLSLSFVNNEQP